MKTVQVLAARALDDRRAVPLLFLLAMAVRIIVAIAFPVAPFSDFAWYYERASEMAAGLGYQEAGVPTAFWPVGYPAILAGMFRIFGASVAVGVIGNLLFAALTFWGMLLFGRTLKLPERAIRVALLGWALYPNAIFYVPQLTSEGPYVALLLFGCWAMMRPGHWRALAAGVLMGLAALVKAQTYIFPIGFLALLWLAFPAQRTRRLAVRAVLIHAAMFAVILPWTARNADVLGSPVLISTNGGYTLLNGNNDIAKGGYINQHDDSRIDDIYGHSGISKQERIARQVEFDRKTKAMAWQWIRTHPADFIKLMPAKLGGLWLSDGDAGWSYKAAYPAAEPMIWRVQLANDIYYMFVLIAAAIATGIAYRRARTAIPISAALFPELLLLAFPAFITLIALLFSGQSRFHAPAMPFLMLLAGLAIFPLQKPASPE